MLPLLADRGGQATNLTNHARMANCAPAQEHAPSVMAAGRAHLVGVAGAGMRSLARLLVEAGWDVTGSDQCLAGHHASAVRPTLDLVVHSAAIAPDNVELQRARELHVPTLGYAETLRLLTYGRTTLAVAGTHGKSTTTAMLVEILGASGLDPSHIFGAARLASDAPGGHCGEDPVFVVEACEYRRHFLQLSPQLAVITGVDADHFDCYPQLDALEEAFAEFADRVPADGVIVRRAECKVAGRATADLAARVVTFGGVVGADWRAVPLEQDRGRYTFRIERAGRSFVECRLLVPGRHNMFNALAAAALAAEFGVPAEAIVAGLSHFRGLTRRLETLAVDSGLHHLDDYAHHPTEVAATLAAIREMYSDSRVWCVFQPHQISRTEHLLDELAVSLQNADKVIVADVFAAREPSTEARSLAVALAELTSRLGAAIVPLHDTDEIAAHLASELQPGDVLATLGAGDIRKVHDGVLDRVRGVRAAA
ncbi:MAG: UDP-N-acetylmuramate--L-alanine ligase [Pirellulales bacterium]|nr:UDP-N-acetylmuramate--L-alanine ligase [Pirellulales bacterium]